MELVYAREPFPTKVTKSLFLAGPTPRSEGISWRKEAIQFLSELGYDGSVFIPEPRSGDWAKHYDEQIVWEENGLNLADQIVFWVPRDMTGDTYGCPMPGLTTNTEFGFWANSGKVVWGAPPSAVSVRFQQYYADKLGIPSAMTLKETLQLALQRMGNGAERVGGECCVPLHVWHKAEFQAWYQSLTSVGNVLRSARVISSFWPKPGFMFSYSLHVDVYIPAEGRSKSNENIFFRTDVSTIVLHGQDEWAQPKIVLVREFRSPVRNSKGYVYELPGGSAHKEGVSPLVTAAEEVLEEVGLALDPSRFKVHETRQLVATLSAHVGSLFSVELTTEELTQLESDKSVHGVEEDTERTYVEVLPVSKILSQNLVDWSTLGMILSVVMP